MSWSYRLKVAWGGDRISPPLRAMPGQSAFLQDGQVGEIMCLGKGVQRSSLEDLFDHPSKC